MPTLFRDRPARKAVPLAGAAVALLVSACATTPKTAADGATVATARDEEVLGLVGPQTPVLLRDIAQAPYAAPDPRTCETIARELAGLDAVLGPDVDVADADGEDQIGEWARGAVRGLVPYRGVVRFLTGAGRRERELAQAVLAGTARRGYLKGLRESLACPFPAPARPSADPAS
ncbi:MAG: hypothetical protein PHG43_05835 [Phenylobacterium sp.]|nr:hypothetical protein [Phenylobacterium sp.]